MNSFQEFNIADSTLVSLTQMGIIIPTEIQSKTIPILLNHPVDFIGLAQTGTGKTAAYGIPLIEKMESFQQYINALIVVPTRELCLQICDQLTQIAGSKKGLTIVPVYGGSAITKQIKQVKQLPSIVVATPGRLIDLIDRKAIKLHTIEYVILDEADEMLNMGFQEDINKILASIKSDHNVWLFSATMPKAIRKIVDQYMVDPTEVSVIEAQRINKDIDHQFLITQAKNKTISLMALLNHEPNFYGIVFCRTKKLTQELSDLLNDYRFPSEALHGDLSQAQRERVMKNFRAKRTHLIIATDVAARGIDVDDLTHIIHYNLPDDLSYYTHRSGRTARAGKKGISLILATRGDQRKIKLIEKSLKISIRKIELPSIDKIQQAQVINWARGLMEISETHISDELIDAALQEFDEIDGVTLLKKLIAQLLGENGAIRPDSESTSLSHYEKMFISLGKNDQLGKQDLIKLLVKNSSLRKSEIGTIDLGRRHSLVQIQKDVYQKTLRQLKGLKHKRKKVQVREDRK